MEQRPGTCGPAHCTVAAVATLPVPGTGPVCGCLAQGWRLSCSTAHGRGVERACANCTVQQLLQQQALAHLRGFESFTKTNTSLEASCWQAWTSHSNRVSSNQLSAADQPPCHLDKRTMSLLVIPRPRFDIFGCSNCLSRCCSVALNRRGGGGRQRCNCGAVPAGVCREYRDKLLGLECG